MKDDTIDMKQKAILDAAWRAFAAYGFRKTSMDDIARGAGMSRPALYLRYKNKEDIVRNLAQMFYDEASMRVQDALGGEGDVTQRLSAAFAAGSGEVIKALMSSPHGLELLDTSTATACDIVEAGEERLIAIYASWLTEQAAEGNVYLSGPATDIAATFNAALYGIKTSAPDYATYSARVAQLAALFGAGLTSPH